MLRLMARNIGDKVLDSEGTLFQLVDITLEDVYGKLNWNSKY